MRYLLTCMVGTALSASSLGLPTAEPDRTRSPTTQAADQSAALRSGDAEIGAILDRLETKGKAIQGLSCTLIYTYVTVLPIEDRTVKEGTLFFKRAEPNSKFLVHFTVHRVAGVVDRKRQEYFAFDGRWLTERNDKARTVKRMEVVREGEAVDPFEIGKGPFPLPFGQRRDEILRLFDVSLVAPDAAESRGGGEKASSQPYHLRCVPKPGTDLARRYTRVDLFVDRKLELPVRVVTERVADENRIEVEFRDIDLSAAPADSRFDLAVPAGFTVTVERLDGGTPVLLEGDVGSDSEGGRP